MEIAVEKRIREILTNKPIEKIAGFCAVNFAFIPDTSKIREKWYWVDTLVEKLDTATYEVKKDFIVEFAEDRLRVCSYCGALMIEGYYLDGDYACTDDCAVSIYKESGLTKEHLDKDLANAEDDDCETYWTEWE